MGARHVFGRVSGAFSRLSARFGVGRGVKTQRLSRRQRRRGVQDRYARGTKGACVYAKECSTESDEEEGEPRMWGSK